MNIILYDEEDLFDWYFCYHDDYCFFIIVICIMKITIICYSYFYYMEMQILKIYYSHKFYSYNYYHIFLEHNYYIIHLNFIIFFFEYNPHHWYYYIYDLDLLILISNYFAFKFINSFDHDLNNYFFILNE